MAFEGRCDAGCDAMPMPLEELGADPEEFDAPEMPFEELDEFAEPMGEPMEEEGEPMDMIDLEEEFGEERFVAMANFEEVRAIFGDGEAAFGPAAVVQTSFLAEATTMVQSHTIVDYREQATTMNVTMNRKGTRSAMSDMGLGKRSWAQALGRFITAQGYEVETKKAKNRALMKMKWMEQKWGKQRGFVAFKNKTKAQISQRVGEMQANWAKEQMKAEEAAQERIRELQKEIEDKEAEKVRLAQENTLPALVSRVVHGFLKQ